MKTILEASKFTFDPVSNRIDFTAMPGFDQRRLLAVINVNRAELIYATSVPGLGGSYVYPNFGFEKDVSSQDPADVIQIIYDDETASQVVTDALRREIQSTFDIISEKFGIDVNLLSSSFGGENGKQMREPNADAALAIGINQGGILRSPRINPVNNRLQVEVLKLALENALTVTGTISANQGTSPWITKLVNPAGDDLAYNLGVMSDRTQRVTIATDQPAIPSYSVATTGLFFNGTLGSGVAYSSPLPVSNNGSMVFQIGVGAFSGTNPYLDIVIEESIDNGATYKAIYHFPRITINGTALQTPPIRCSGMLVRARREVGGTGSPQVTLVQLWMVTRSVSGQTARSIYERWVNPASTGVGGSALNMEGCTSFTMIVSMNVGGAAPVFKMRGSDNGIDWFDLSGDLTATVGTTTYITAPVGILARYAQVYVKTGGAGSSLNYACIKGAGP